MSADAVAWGDLPAEVTDLARLVEQRFGAHPHHVLATLHRDGRPRVSGTNVMFSDGVMWVGSMPGAFKTLDLRADPRCALHSAPLSEELPAEAADARIEAVATLVEGDRLQELLTEAFGEDATMDGDVWELLVTSMSLVHVDGEQMRIRSWSPGGGYRSTART